MGTTIGCDRIHHQSSAGAVLVCSFECLVLFAARCFLGLWYPLRALLFRSTLLYITQLFSCNPFCHRGRLLHLVRSDPPLAYCRSTLIRIVLYLG